LHKEKDLKAIFVVSNMRITNTQRAYFQLHIAIFLWGFTAILGDLITLEAIPLVWWRVLLTSFSIIFLIPLTQSLKALSRQTIIRLAGIGMIIGLHWILFFASIKLSNPSIALICMATGSFFTAILEPIILKQKMKGYEIFLGLMIVPGMLMIVNSTELSMMNGIWAGIGSALLAAVFTVLNKKYIEDVEPRIMTFLEMSTAWLMVSMMLPVIYYMDPSSFNMSPTLIDLGYLCVLAFLCTTLAFILSLKSLKYISAFATNLSINLEPVYGIIMAAVLLDDLQELNERFYLGCVVILIAVFTYPIIKLFYKRKSVKSVK